MFRVTKDTTTGSYLVHKSVLGIFWLEYVDINKDTNIAYELSSVANIMLNGKIKFSMSPTFEKLLKKNKERFFVEKFKRADGFASKYRIHLKA